MAVTAAAAAVAAAQKMLLKSERHLSSSSDDAAVLKQILATHAADGLEIDVRPLLHVVEELLQRSTPTVLVAPETHLDVVDEKPQHAGPIQNLEALAYPIHKISCEITCNCSGGGDAHATAVHVFNQLSTYTWDTKVVLAMAAFAVSYGEFWLTAKLQTDNPLAKSVALLKQVPDILENTDALKPRFDAVNNLIQTTLNVTKCIIEFKVLPPEYISPDSPEMSMAMAHIPTAVYWAIRSIIACSSQITGLIGLGLEYISETTEAWELSGLAHKLNNMHGHLTKQLGLCHQLIYEKRLIEAYSTLVRLFETSHYDNIKILKTMIHSKDDLPLFDAQTKSRVSVDVLRRKMVMLFISDIDISNVELSVLIQKYKDAHEALTERHYEIVWLPVTDRNVPWTPANQEEFDRLASEMPWYSLRHPDQLDPAVIKYIRDVWRFDRKPLLVALDPQGKVVSPNALHMMWIWGGVAYPFTSNREEALWREATWRLEFVVDEIDHEILQWVREGRHICLYGGEDLDWIRQFTTTLRRVSLEAKVQIEMIYVGKSNPNERVKKITSVIADEKLSGHLQYPEMAWFFWDRLESMWHSLMQRGRKIEEDPILQEVMTMLSFDGSDEGWALISWVPQSSHDHMVKALGRKMVNCLNQFDTWKADVEKDGFVPALTKALLPFHTHEHCTRLILPEDTGRIQEQVVCAECKKPMERFVLYRCCSD